ncbi:hypothetical protein Ahy_A07g034535 isoform A [Arachis hypogaea]|uniref:HIT domain-containing protein n=1 Tax=Arachis hypogaea TaxID=3818 RepID=A0A445CC42_ARAHY|nr:hypothetical protein Ahy_A07g034535 isoform A [Arachis hypogaea]
MKGLKNGMSSVSRRNITQRLVVFASHLPSSSSSSSDSTSMASEKQAALATAPSDADAPTIFDKIINKEIPSNVVYEDDKVFAFRDINPQAPTHILIIPKVKDGLTGLSKVFILSLSINTSQSHYTNFHSGTDRTNEYAQWNYFFPRPHWCTSSQAGNSSLPGTLTNALIAIMAEERHFEILGRLLYTAKLIAKQEGLDDGFRVVINDGPKGCQSVYHIHVHLLGGRQMNWPPG